MIQLPWKQNILLACMECNWIPSAVGSGLSEVCFSQFSLNSPLLAWLSKDNVSDGDCSGAISRRYVTHS